MAFSRIRLDSIMVAHMPKYTYICICNWYGSISFNSETECEFSTECPVLRYILSSLHATNNNSSMNLNTLFFFNYSQLAHMNINEKLLNWRGYKNKKECKAQHVSINIQTSENCNEIKMNRRNINKFIRKP